MNNQQELNELKNKILTLSKEIEELKKNDISQEFLQEIKELAQKLDISSLEEKIPQEDIKKITEKSKTIIKQIEEFTKNHPFVTILGAMTIGYLMGKTKK